MKLNFKKLGVIFNPSEYSDSPYWMKGFAQAPNAIILNGRVRVYFCTRGHPDANKMYISRLAYVDLNPSNLNVVTISKEPCLSLGSLGEFDEFGTYPVSVLNQNGSIHAAYGGWTRCESVPFNISIGRSSSGKSILASILDNTLISVCLRVSNIFELLSSIIFIACNL